MDYNVIQSSNSSTNEIRKSQKTSTNIVFLFAIVIITILSFISVYEFYNLLRLNRWVSHTYEVISSAQNSLYDLTYLEIRQRGYLSFNDKSYIPYFNEDLSKLDNSLQNLVTLTKDNPSQNQKAVQLSLLI